MKISAVILVKNEERKIEKAIKSVSFCSEIMVVDDNSTDSSVALAKEAGAIIYNRPLQGDFASQRNWAMTQAINEWILFLDADEIVSEELKQSIITLATIDKTSTENQPVAFAIPRRDFFWDTELKHGETFKSRDSGIIRILKKGSGKWVGTIHEKFETTGLTSKLPGFIDHYSHESLSSFIKKVNGYSTLRANELGKTGKKISKFELIVFPFGKFIYTYFILGGFLDGAAGFVYSFVMSFHSFLVRAKLVTNTYA